MRFERYGIDYDDGDKEDGIEEERIRILGEGSRKGTEDSTVQAGDVSGEELKSPSQAVLVGWFSYMVIRIHIGDACMWN